MTRSPNPRGTGEQLRAQLVASASAMLTSAQPVALPSLRAVARACGVSPSAVYLHFDSQVALLRAVVDAQLRSMRSALLEEYSGGTAREHIVAIGRRYARWGIAHPGAYQLIFETAPQAGVTGSDDPENDIIGMLGDLVAASRSGDVESARADAMLLWASVHGLVLLRIHKPALEWPRSLEDDIERVAHAIVPAGG
ncbi:MAG: TetR/AcrR family transcriptional regulator [Microcella sp.]|uniref:TetR/AcrR family transcriptional regulator n=1 Tax=Microcella sp. TaxID=1913979 RepID=UPI00331540E0